MMVMRPSQLTDFEKAINEAKHFVERGKPDAIASVCRPLLSSVGSAEVDHAVGVLLKLLLRHGSASSVAAIEADAFPLDRLQKGWNPQNVSVAYLCWKYRITILPEQQPDPEQAKTLVAAAEALWPHVDEASRLLHGLYVKLANAYAALGNVQALQGLGVNLLAGPMNDERQRTALQRIIKQLQQLRASLEIAVLLQQFLARSEQDPGQAEVVLTAVAALRELAQTLSDFKRLMSFLALVVEWLTSAGADLCDKRIALTMIRCADFEGLHTLLPHLLAHVQDITARTTLLAVLEHLRRYDLLGDAVHSFERIYREDPGDATAALLFARSLPEADSVHTGVEDLFRAARQEVAGYDEAVIKAAWLFFGRKGQFDKIISWFDAHPLNDRKKADFLLNRAHAATERPSLPYCIEGADAERLCLDDTGTLATLLTPLVHATNGDLSYNAQPSRDELRGRLHGIEEAVNQVTAQKGSLTPSTCLSIARELNQAATIHLRDTIAERHAAPIAVGPQYGRLDVARMTDVFETLHRVALELSQYGIMAALHDAPLTDVRDLCQLAELHAQSAFALGQPQASEVVLQAIHAHRVAPALILRLLERCALQRGDLRTAEQHIVGQVIQEGEILAIEPFDIWSQKATSGCDVLVDEQSWKGTFEYRDSQGSLHQAPHEVPATRIQLFRVAALRIRDSELLISQRGAIPHPHPWHLRHVYGYPRRSSIYINHGEGGCRLRPARESLQLCEPLVVLFNMDALHYRNYYHWMLLILTRVAILLDHGFFEDRRLLLPVELSEWMKQSLDLLGLPEERIRYFSAAQEVFIENALLAGSVEFAAAALIKPVQRRLWAAAGVDPTTSRGSLPVWLSRRRQHLRHLANTDAAEALARQLGFHVVEPESLSLKDQVRLCAEAKAVAGPDGASLTNLMFARPGTPVLGLVNENNNYPTFVDLCAVMDLPQRWLFGRSDQRKAWWGLHHEPYEVETTVLEQELRRLVAPR